MSRCALLLALSLPLAACATRKQVAAKPLDGGLSSELGAPFDAVKRAALDSLSELNFSVKEERWDPRDSDAYVILSSQGLSSGSTGRYARVVILRGEAKQTVRVLVESKAAVHDAAAVDEAIARDLQSRIEKRSGSR